MKLPSKRSLLFFAVSLAVLLGVIVLLIVSFMYRNQERIIRQNQQYLEDAAVQSVHDIEEYFSNASNSIKIVSRLYELQLDSPKFDYKLLDDMSEPTPFDYIRFVGADGTSWSGDGETIDCSDRDYFREGMEGRSGVNYIGSSRFTQTPILCFYAPLYYEGEIVGVVNGVMESSRLSEHLAFSFFGVPSDTCIILQDRTVVAASWWADGNPDNPDFSTASVPDGDTPALEDAIKKNRSVGFRYNGGMGNAYLAPLYGGQFLLVQTLPPSVSQSLAANANRDAFELEISLIAVFAVYLLLVAWLFLRRNRNLSRQKEHLGQIVDSVKRLYRRFVVFDLDNDTYEYLKEGDISRLGIPRAGRYSDWLEALARQQAANPDYWGSAGRMDVDTLRGALTQEAWFRQTDYQVPGGSWERLSLIKLDMDQEHTSRILGAVEDVTSVKRQDEENRQALEAAYHAAEAANRAKSDFLSRMSHDIRTPMNAIIGLTAIMGAHLDDRERIIDCLAKITSSSKHLLGLINEVLDMSKIEAGKLVLSEEPFSLSAMVDNLMDIVRTTVNAKHQELAVQIRDVSHEDVIGDSLRLQQVLVNLMSNAVKYTGENGHISLTLSELPGKQPLLGEYVVVVEDDGVGMSPAFLEKIFSPFERADEQNGKTQGTGLGMSIAQSLVRLMGGSIAVESTLGKGTRFTVRLSLKLQEVNEEAIDRLADLPVLVADDEQIACETTCLLLSELGMDGEWVLTGREAVDRTAARHSRGEDYFAVILDWKMPEMDGLETAKAIRREIGHDVPIIILSAYDWSEIEAEARAAGVSAFIGKPLFKSRLRGVFMDLVGVEPPPASDPLGEIREHDYTGRRALLVEDNELNQEVAREILEMTGLEVDVAENGKVSVERFAEVPEGHYDIIFMDVQMPIMNGYEATRAIRALDREDAKRIPIVAMTANTFNEDVQSAMDAGMNQHIGKPLDIDQLGEVLEKWLG